jgi:hypothetical protein
MAGMRISVPFHVVRVESNKDSTAYAVAGVVPGTGLPLNRAVKNGAPKCEILQEPDYIEAEAISYNTTHSIIISAPCIHGTAQESRALIAVTCMLRTNLTTRSCIVPN